MTQNIPKPDLIEQSLQVLTSLSYQFEDEISVIEYFCEEMDIINYLLIKINVPFLKSKLCSFYSFNLSVLFHNDVEVLSKSFEDSMNFLFDCIFNESSNPSLVKVALRSVNNVIFDNTLKKFCSTAVYINAIKVVNFFNKKENLDGNDEEFNEFIKGIIKDYMYDLGDYALQLFDLFWEKFLAVFQKIIKTSLKNMRTIFLEKR